MSYTRFKTDLCKIFYFKNYKYIECRNGEWTAYKAKPKDYNRDVLERCRITKEIASKVFNEMSEGELLYIPSVITGEKVDWEEVKPGTPVMVKENIDDEYENWKFAYYQLYLDGIGHIVLISKGSGTVEFYQTIYYACQLATEQDINAVVAKLKENNK